MDKEERSLASADILWTRGEGINFFAIFCGRFMDGPTVRTNTMFSAILAVLFAIKTNLFLYI